MGNFGRGVPRAARLAAAVLLLLFCSHQAMAAVWYVNAASTAAAPDGKGWTTAYRTIQQAVVVSASGDAVWVAKGVYTGIGTEVVNLKAGITLYGGFAGTETTLDQRDWNGNQSIIDGQRVRRCITAANNTATVDGFTLRKGNADWGGGMYHGTATNCTFTGNSATRYNGGGMQSGTATNCTFTGNSANDGGGMCGLTATNCVFAGNSANFGGGMRYGTATNCVFAGNSAYGYGGGMYDGTATNCTFVGNSAYDGGGTFGGTYGGTATNCVMWDNAPNDADYTNVTYSLLSQPFSGTGNLVGLPVFINPQAGDFRLRSGSPGIDAGTATGAPTADLLGRVRPQGAGVDMGAYELTPEDAAEPVVPVPVLRVNAVSMAANPDGLTWETAFSTLQAAADRTGYGGEIWVAAGTYTGTGTEVVRLLPGTVLLGGFAGTETDRDQRDATVYRTVIDGQAARRGVTATPLSLVNGVTIQNGTAQYGGGMFCGTAANCMFTENSADYGGGMYSGTATNCVFRGDSADYDGGGMYSGTATNCMFTENSADYGGGMHSGTATNCTFTGNSADEGGGMRYGTATNCTFTGNSADEGGGMCAGTATNCTFTENAATDKGGGMCSVRATNCVVWGNSPDETSSSGVSYSLLSQPVSGTGNIVDTPVFINPLVGDFRLRSGSPGIDAGTATGAPATDLLGRVRPQGAGVDMGAYEHTPGDDAAPVVPAPILRVNAASTAASPDGLTWETAFPTLQEAADRCVGYGGEIWVAAGTYTGTGAEAVRLRPGTVLLGGFAGAETVRDQQDATTNRTVIDGQKARRGVTGTASSCVDGVTIQNGAADRGGGMCYGTATNCTFTGNSATDGGGMCYGTATNCTFTGNSANYGGGGWYGTATNCVFAGNSATGYGGGMCDGTATNCTFTENAATDGGGTYDGTATNCTFTENAATRYGGGMCYGTVTNCTFTENAATDDGGGVWYGTATNCTLTGNSATRYGGGMCAGTATNCTFMGNAATDEGGGMYDGTATNCTFTGNSANYGGGMRYGTATNCIFWRNDATDVLGTSVSYSCLGSPVSGVGNIVGDPLFADEQRGDFRLGIGSPCINAGTVTDAPATDILGISRPQGAGVDMGAYEKPLVPTSVPDVVGLARAAAHELVVAARLYVRGETEQYHPSIPADQVMRQYPVAGVEVPVDWPVDLVISKGPEPVPVPALVGLARGAAHDLVVAARLYVRAETERYDAVVPADQVMEQYPGAGIMVLPDSPVDLVISKGPLVLVSVPDLSGLARMAAAQALYAARLYTGAQSEEYHPTVPQDHVIGQMPEGGTQAPQWSRVDLIISRGPLPLVSVPDLSGVARGAVQQLLAAAQLYAGAQSEEYHATVPQDHVIRQTPGGGTQAPLWSRVDYVVSRGPEPVSMPDIVGLARGAARELLAAAQLYAPNETVTYHASVPANHVASQSPAAGTLLPPGTAVSYVLSLGPVPVEGEPAEGEPVTPDTVREQLASAVAEADTSGDGTLSYDEAAGAVPGLTQDVFDAIDTNGDGQLSPSELAGERSGCAGRSDCGDPDWATRMADLLLVLLGALGLGYLSGTQRP